MPVTLKLGSFHDSLMWPLLILKMVPPDIFRIKNGSPGPFVILDSVPFYQNWLERSIFRLNMVSQIILSVWNGPTGTILNMKSCPLDRYKRGDRFARNSPHISIKYRTCYWIWPQDLLLLTKFWSTHTFQLIRSSNIHV